MLPQLPTLEQTLRLCLASPLAHSFSKIRAIPEVVLFGHFSPRASSGQLLLIMQTAASIGSSETFSDHLLSEGPAFLSQGIHAVLS